MYLILDLREDQFFPFFTAVQKKRKPLYCQFDIEPKLDHHIRQAVSSHCYCMSCIDIYFQLQAVVLEGKYWKRKVDAVASEYRKWRFYKEKNVISTYLGHDVIVQATI